jgi:proteasome lid subunit RPN8/RPN11
LLRIGKQFVDGMIAHALEEDPNECCGILAGKNEVVSQLYRITNTAASPYRYLMDPQEFLNADRDSERNGWEHLAFYHSHTHSPAYPSQTDVRMALESGWLEIYYVLVTLEDKENPALRAFHITEGGDIVEECIEYI